MNLKVEQKEGSTVLYINEKRLDADKSSELKGRILELLREGEVHLVIELGDVRFIDSSGLGVLLSAYKNSVARQGSLVLTGLQPQVQSMFELTRLHRVFKIHPTLQQALGKG